VASDLLASLRIWSIADIAIGDQIFRVPALPAVDWLEILLQDEISLWSIVPGLLEPDATETFTEAIFKGEIPREDWEQLVWELVSIAAGRPWWTTLYLISNTQHFNNIEYVKGQLALHGVDATKMSLSAWLDAVYFIFIQHMKPEDKQKFDLLLARPIPGTKVKTDAKANRAAFGALLSS
jgi:hypothetical protein